MSTAPSRLLPPPGSPPHSPFAAIPDNMAKENISLAYLKAIIAQIGLNSKEPTWDDGVDLDVGSTKPVVKDFPCRNIWITLQVKSTADWEIKGDRLAYFLKKSNYEQLRSLSLQPQYLVLYTLPKTRSRWSWVQHKDEHAEFHGKAFFLSLQGAPEIKPRRRNRERCGKTVYFPTTNHLTAYKLRKLYVDAVLAAKATVRRP